MNFYRQDNIILMFMSIFELLIEEVRDSYDNYIDIHFRD